MAKGLTGHGGLGEAAFVFCPSNKRGDRYPFCDLSRWPYWCIRRYTMDLDELEDGLGLEEKVETKQDAVDPLADFEDDDKEPEAAVTFDDIPAIPALELKRKEAAENQRKTVTVLVCTVRSLLTFVPRLLQCRVWMTL
jgi:hypothetical protein